MDQEPKRKIGGAAEKKRFISPVSMKKRTKLLLLLFIIGFFETFPLGFLGSMPVDQSMVFEAAGRIVNGEVLFKDFYI
jgi:hypothetical protein